MSSLQDMPNLLFISMTGLKVVLQSLGWHCVECAIHGMCAMCAKNNTHIYVARTSNNRVLPME